MRATRPLQKVQKTNPGSVGSGRGARILGRPAGRVGLICPRASLAALIPGRYTRAYASCCKGEVYRKAFRHRCRCRCCCCCSLAKKLTEYLRRSIGDVSLDIITSILFRRRCRRRKFSMLCAGWSIFLLSRSLAGWLARTRDEQISVARARTHTRAHGCRRARARPQTRWRSIWVEIKYLCLWLEIYL